MTLTRLLMVPALMLFVLISARNGMGIRSARDCGTVRTAARQEFACELASSRSSTVVPFELQFWNRMDGLGWFRSLRCRTAFCDFLAATRDGGKTWPRVYRPRSVSQIAVKGVGDAWLVEDACDFWPACRPRLLASTDRGRRWRVVGKGVVDLTMATTRIGFGSLYDRADRWRLQRTADGGRTWSSTESPCSEKGPWGTPHVAFSSERVGWVACGGQPGAGNQLKSLLATTDGGQTWRLRIKTGARTAGPFSSSGYLASVAALGRRLWVTEMRAYSFVSDDSGRTWRRIPFTKPDAVEITDLSPVSEDTAFALVRLHERDLDLRRTDDGGRTWRVVHRWRYG